MRYIKNLFVAEMVTFGIAMALIISAGILAIPVLGITDSNAAYDVGLSIGSIGGIIMRIAMIIVGIVTIIKTKNN